METEAAMEEEYYTVTMISDLEKGWISKRSKSDAKFGKLKIMETEEPEAVCGALLTLEKQMREAAKDDGGELSRATLAALAWPALGCARLRSGTARRPWMCARP